MRRVPVHPSSSIPHPLLILRIKDVALAAGVSTATVSHVINDTRRVTEETRRRVLATIRELNYYPNAQARSLASGRSMTLGLVISDISNPFFPEVVKAIEDAAFERGYDVVLANTSYDPARTTLYARRFIERKLAGVVMMTSELDEETVDELRRQQVAVTFLDIGRAAEHMSNIVINYEQGIEEAVAHLVRLGHRRIAYIGGPERLSSAARRRSGFVRSLARRLPGESARVAEADFRLEGGRRAADELFAAADGGRPTAVLAANDMMALGCVRAARARGLRVPEDISVVGFDDIAFAALADPPLTTVCVPRDELGARAVEAVMLTIEHPERHGVEMRIDTRLEVRASTAKTAG